MTNLGRTVFVHILAIAAAFSFDAKRHGRQSPAKVISKIQKRMQEERKNSLAQLTGCGELELLADLHREGPGPFGGRRVSTELLDAGIGEALALGLQNAVAADVAQGKQSPSAASRVCEAVIGGLTVQDDYVKGLHLIEKSPHLWKAVVSYYSSFRNDRAVLGHLCTFAGLFGTPQPSQAVCGLAREGGFSLVLDILDRNDIDSDPALFQTAWCALSDNVNADRCASEAIAHHGGPLQGIPLLVRALQRTRQSATGYHEAHGFGLLYEAVHVTAGIMAHDDANRTYTDAFLRAGYMNEVVPIMKLLPDDAALQENACRAIKFITDGPRLRVQDKLANLGVLEHIANSLRKFSHSSSGVVTCCSGALLNFANGRPTFKEKLQLLGVQKTLDAELLQAFPPSWDDGAPWRPLFPSSNIHTLKRLLVEGHHRRAVVSPLGDVSP